MTFKEIIKLELVNQGINQTELAKRLNVSRQNVSNLLDKQTPSIETIQKFANALKIEVNYLIDLVYKEGISITEPISSNTNKNTSASEIDLMRKYIAVLEEKDRLAQEVENLRTQLLERTLREKQEAQEKSEKL